MEDGWGDESYWVRKEAGEFIKEVWHFVHYLKQYFAMRNRAAFGGTANKENKMIKLSTALILMVVFAPPALVVGHGIKMKRTDFLAESHPINPAGMMFAEALGKTASKQVKMTICPYRAVGPSTKVLEPDIPGAADMSPPTPGQFDKYSPKMQLRRDPVYFGQLRRLGRSAGRWIHPVDRKRHGTFGLYVCFESEMGFQEPDK